MGWLLPRHEAAASASPRWSSFPSVRFAFYTIEPVRVFRGLRHRHWRTSSEESRLAEWSFCPYSPEAESSFWCYRVLPTCCCSASIPRPLKTSTSLNEYNFLTVTSRSYWLHRARVVRATGLAFDPCSWVR